MKSTKELFKATGRRGAGGFRLRVEHNHARYIALNATVPVGTLLSRQHWVAPRALFSSQPMSTAAAAVAAADAFDPATDRHDPSAPAGELFRNDGTPATTSATITQLVGQHGRIRHVFGPRANSQALIICGGDHLAAHASFDPHYDRAMSWIRHHAVGPAVLSPILLQGLTGALVEAAFPQSVFLQQTMQQIRPLIVACPVLATITVQTVQDAPRVTLRHGAPHGHDSDDGGSTAAAANAKPQHGYQVDLDTRVARVRDDAVIVQGTHSIWIPDYKDM